MWSGALKVVAVAALVGFLLLSANDVAIKVEPGGLEEMVAFDAARKEILSPTLSGPMLSFLAWLVTETPLRPVRKASIDYNCLKPKRRCYVCNIDIFI